MLTGLGVIRYGLPTLILACGAIRFNLVSFGYVLLFFFYWLRPPLRKNEVARTWVISLPFFTALVLYSGLACLSQALFQIMLASGVASVTSVTSLFHLRELTSWGYGLRYIAPDWILFITAILCLRYLRREVANPSPVHARVYGNQKDFMFRLIGVASLWLSGGSHASILNVPYFLAFSILLLQYAIWGPHRFELWITTTRTLRHIIVLGLVYTILHLSALYIYQLGSVDDIMSSSLADTLGFFKPHNQLSTEYLCRYMACVAQAFLYVTLAMKLDGWDVHTIDINQLANQPFLHRSSTIKDSRLTAVFTMSLTMRASLLRLIREQGRFLCQAGLFYTCFNRPSTVTIILLLVFCITVVLDRNQFAAATPWILLYCSLAVNVQYWFEIPNLIPSNDVLYQVGLQRTEVPFTHLIDGSFPVFFLAGYYMLWQLSDSEPSAANCGNAAATGDLRLLLKAAKSDPQLLLSRDIVTKSTLLHLAAKAGHRHIVRLLIKSKVPINAQDNYGNTALHLAESHGRIRSALLLRQAPGVDVTLKNTAGHTADQVVPGLRTQLWSSVASALRTLRLQMYIHAEKFSLAALYIAGMPRADLIHLVYLLFFLVFIAAPSLARRGWWLLVAYCAAVLLLMFGYAVWQPSPDNVELRKDYAYFGLQVVTNPWSDLAAYYAIFLLAAFQLYAFKRKDKLRRHAADSPYDPIWQGFVLFICYATLLVVGLIEPVSLSKLGYLMIFCMAMFIHQWAKPARVLEWLYRFWIIFVLPYTGLIVFALYAYQYPYISDWIIRIYPVNPRLTLQDIGLVLPGEREETSFLNGPLINLFFPTCVFLVCVLHARTLRTHLLTMDKNTRSGKQPPAVANARGTLNQTTALVTSESSSGGSGWAAGGPMHAPSWAIAIWRAIEWLFIHHGAKITILFAWFGMIVTYRNVANLLYLLLIAVTLPWTRGDGVWAPVTFYAVPLVAARYLFQLQAVKNESGPASRFFGFEDWTGKDTAVYLHLLRDLIIIALCTLQRVFSRPAEPIGIVQRTESFRAMLESEPGTPGGNLHGGFGSGMATPATARTPAQRHRTTTASSGQMMIPTSSSVAARALSSQSAASNGSDELTTGLMTPPGSSSILAPPSSYSSASGAPYLLASPSSNAPGGIVSGMGALEVKDSASSSSPRAAATSSGSNSNTRVRGPSSRASIATAGATGGGDYRGISGGPSSNALVASPTIVPAVMGAPPPVQDTIREDDDGEEPEDASQGFNSQGAHRAPLLKRVIPAILQDKDKLGIVTAEDESKDKQKKVGVSSVKDDGTVRIERAWWNVFKLFIADIIARFTTFIYYFIQRYGVQLTLACLLVSSFYRATILSLFYVIPICGAYITQGREALRRLWTMLCCILVLSTLWQYLMCVVNWDAKNPSPWDIELPWAGMATLYSKFYLLRVNPDEMHWDFFTLFFASFQLHYFRQEIDVLRRAAQARTKGTFEQLEKALGTKSPRGIASPRGLASPRAGLQASLSITMEADDETRDGDDDSVKLRPLVGSPQRRAAAAAAEKSKAVPKIHEPTIAVLPSSTAALASSPAPVMKDSSDISPTMAPSLGVVAPPPLLTTSELDAQAAAQAEVDDAIAEREALERAEALRIWPLVRFTLLIIVDKILIVFMFYAGTNHADIISVGYVVYAIMLLYQQYLYHGQIDKCADTWAGLHLYNLGVLALNTLYQLPYIPNQLSVVGSYMTEWQNVIGIWKFEKTASGLGAHGALNPIIIFFLIDAQNLLLRSPAFDEIREYYNESRRQAVFKGIESARVRKESREKKLRSLEDMRVKLNAKFVEVFQMIDSLEQRFFNDHETWPSAPPVDWVSDNAQLANITVSSGLLLPPFKPQVGEYVVSVKPAVTIITVAAMSQDQHASITLSWRHPGAAPIVKGLTNVASSSVEIPLVNGDTHVTMVCVAEDNQTRKEYRLRIERHGLPSSSSGHLPTMTSLPVATATAISPSSPNVIISPNGMVVSSPSNDTTGGVAVSVGAVIPRSPSIPELVHTQSAKHKAHALPQPLPSPASSGVDHIGESKGESKDVIVTPVKDDATDDKTDDTKDDEKKEPPAPGCLERSVNALRRSLINHINPVIWAEYTTNGILKGRKDATSFGDIPARPTEEEYALVPTFYLLLRWACSHTKWICCIAYVINLMYNANFISLVVPVLLLCYGLIENPRAPKAFWMFILSYTGLVVAAKFLFQVAVFCVSGSVERLYSLQPNADCSLQPIPDSYQFDYLLGIHKISSDRTVFSFVGWELLCMLCIVWHREVLCVRGLWDRSEEQLGDPVLTTFIMKQLQADEDSKAEERERIRAIERNKRIEERKRRKAEKAAFELAKQEMKLQQQALRSGDALPGDELLAQTPEEFMNAETPLPQQAGAAADFVPVVAPANDVTATNGAPLVNTTSTYDINADEVEPSISIGDRIMNGLKYVLPREIIDYYVAIVPARDPSMVEVKPGRDLYMPSFLVELVSALYIILYYPQMASPISDSVGSSLTTNLFSGGMVLMFFLQIILILVDRALYLYHSIIGKLLLQYATVVFWFAHIFFIWPRAAQQGFMENVHLRFFFVLKCFYFIVGAQQLHHGYPPVESTGFQYLTRTPSIFNGYIYRVYRAIPFVFEIRTLLDWMCSKSALDIWETFKLEDIYQWLYIVQCDIIYRKAHKRGETFGFVRKLFDGCIILAVLLLIVFGPLLLFSSANPATQSNNVQSAQVELSLVGESGEWNLLRISSVARLATVDEKEYSNMKKLKLIDDGDDQGHIQTVTMVRYSDEFWQISPPSLTQLSDTLADYKYDMQLKFQYYFTRDGPEGSKTISSTNLLTIDIDARKGFQRVLNRTDAKVNIYIDKLIPPYLRLPATSSPIPMGKRDYKRAMLRINNFVTNQTASSSYLGNVWWNMTEIDPDDNKEKEVKFITVSNPIWQGPMFGGASYSIMGLYFTVFITIGQFVRFFFANQVQRIPYEDLHDANDLVQFCEGICIARQTRDHIKEEKLYRQLIKIYRTPELLLRLTARVDRKGDSESADKLLERQANGGSDPCNDGNDATPQPLRASASGGSLARLPRSKSSSRTQPQPTIAARPITPPSSSSSALTTPPPPSSQPSQQSSTDMRPLPRPLPPPAE